MAGSNGGVIYGAEDGGVDGGVGSSIPLLDGTVSGAPVGTVPMDGVLLESNQPGQQFKFFTQAKYPPGAWDPHLRAQVVLAEFASTEWKKVHLDRWSDGGVESDINELVVLRGRRQARLWEIVAQAQDLELHWKSMLAVGPCGRPNTAAVIASAIAIGHMVGMYWKDHYERPRPVQLFPALLPVIPTPSHPSYPSNHSFQSNLVAHAVHSIFKADVAAIMGPPLFQLAARIGKNREIAGVHFPADTAAGSKLAQDVAPLMKGLETFQQLREAARSEWPGLTVGGRPENVNGGPAFADVVASRVVEKMNERGAVSEAAGANGATPKPAKPA